MWILIVILAGVILFGLIAGYFYNRNIQKKIDRGELKEAPPVVTVDSECCGQHQICEKESLLAVMPADFCILSFFSCHIIPFEFLHTKL